MPRACPPVILMRRRLVFAFDPPVVVWRGRLVLWLVLQTRLCSSALLLGRRPRRLTACRRLRNRLAARRLS